MNNVYIQCNGFRQLAKISSFLLTCPIDVKYSDVSIKTTMSDTNLKFEIYLISFPHCDHVGFWEFLMDYAPIPDRFIWCDDDPADLEASENIVGINLYTLLYNIALVSSFLSNMVRNKMALMRGGIPEELRARSCGFISYDFNRFIDIEYFPMWIDTSIEDTEPLIIRWY